MVLSGRTWVMTRTTRPWQKGKKLVSGEHASVRNEVRKQIPWPHQMLDAVVCPEPPEYCRLTLIQFAACYSAIVLSNLPPGWTNSESCNQLRHMNRLFTLAMKVEWHNVLEFNTAFFRQIELMSYNWEDWDKIKDWHNRNLDALQMSGLKPKKLDWKDDKDDKRDEMCEGVPMRFLKANKLCKKFQSGLCDQTAPHALLSGTLLLTPAPCASSRRSA